MISASFLSAIACLMAKTAPMTAPTATPPEAMLATTANATAAAAIIQPKTRMAVFIFAALSICLSDSLIFSICSAWRCSRAPF